MDRETEHKIYLEVMARFLESDHGEATILVNRIKELTITACSKCQQEKDEAFRNLSMAYNMLSADMRERDKDNR